MAKGGIDFRFKGVKELIENLEIAGERGLKAVGAGLYLEANNVMADSLREVPVKDSALKNSKYVTLPNIQGTRVQIEMGYGGSAKLYAEKQHERTDFKHPQGGKAKFLQDPLMSAKSNFTKNVAIFAGRSFAADKGASKVSDMNEKPE